MKHIMKLALLLMVCSNAVYGQQGVRKVVIIRHGEKPPMGNNLSCMGMNRALQLAGVLAQKFGKVDAIFAPAVNNGRTTNQARMFQTISPYAIKNNLDINTKYMVSDVNGVATALQAMNGTILVVWEHNAIEKLVRSLGIADKQQWGADDFDSIWIITWANGKAVLTKDAENIKPSANCN